MSAIDGITAANTNLAAGGALPVDHSFSPYPGGGSGADTGDAVMSFGDFLDMINPLQHVPVISALVRGATGENINPVSRIAGDALYGGVLGLASAGISALGAVGDEAVAAMNGGQSASMMFASLFGSGTDSGAETQLAANTAPAPEQTVADTKDTSTPVLQSLATQSPILDIPALTSVPAVESVQVAATPAAQTSPVAALTANTGAETGIVLDRSKAVYSGGIDSAMLQKAQQNQTLALALAGGAKALDAQHSLRNNRFAVAPTVSDNLPAKGISQYQNAAQSQPVTGALVDATN